MNPQQFVDNVDGFSSLPAPRQNEYLLYYLTIIAGKQTASGAEIGRLRSELHLASSNVSRQFSNGLKGKDRRYVRHANGYTLVRNFEEKLTSELRVQLDRGGSPVTPRNATSHDNERISTGNGELIFIGSSVEGKAVAEAIQVNLDHDMATQIWTQNVFAPSSSTIESLYKTSELVSHAILVLTPDDETTKRGALKPAPRDNLLFELGFFMGRLGRERTFIVRPRGVDMALPSDLLGITCLDYALRADLSAALGACCTKLKRAIRHSSS